MIVRNEAGTLPTCLASVAELGLEIIVVDTGSTDGTPEVARQFGAHVFAFPWDDDFAAARNETLRHATGAWIFWLDADESLDEPNHAKLRALLADLQPEPAAYLMSQHSTGGRSPRGVHVRQVRLFRNDPAIRWEYRLHEQVLPALHRAGHEIRDTDIVIHHTGYQDPALRKRKLERNLRVLERDHADHPDDPFVLFNLGVAYASLGRPATAVPVFLHGVQCCSSTDPLAPRLCIALVRAFDRLDQQREARAACRAGLLHWPQDSELWFLEGQFRHIDGDPAGAEACWRQVLAQGVVNREPEPGPPLEPTGEKDGGNLLPGAGVEGQQGLAAAARHRLALLCRDQGRTAEAESLWRDALAEEPEWASAWQGLGDLYLAQARWTDLEQVTGRLAILPGGAQAAEVLRARAFLARREYGPARQLLEAFIAKMPEALAPRLYLTHVLLQEGRDLAAAEQALRTVLALDPSQSETWRNLAVLLRNLDRLPEALAVCREARAHSAEDGELLLIHGLLLHDAGDLASAEGCLLRLLEREAAAPGPPNGIAAARPAQVRRVRALHQLALICRSQGRLAAAESHWRAALVEMPDLPAAWQGLGELALMQGRLAEVEGCLTRLQASAPGAVAVGLLRARLHLERQEFGPARQLLERLIAHEPKAPEPRRLLSYVLLQEGTDAAAAEQALRDLLVLAPGDAEARHNLAVLLGQQQRGCGSGRPA
jgi:tetratricopeptide (TPR) repeat protein